MSTPATGQLDPMLGDPYGQSLAELLAAGHWQPVHEALTAAPGPARYFLMTGLAQLDLSWPSAWVEEHPGESVPWSALGFRLLHRAAEARAAIRTNRPAPHQEADAAGLLHEARAAFGNAGPDETATTRLGLLRVAIAEQAPVAERQALLDEALRIDPDHLAVYRYGAEALSGPHVDEQDLAMAVSLRGLTRRAPSLANAAPAYGHLQVWRDLGARRLAKDRTGAARDYITDRKVARALRDAASRSVFLLGTHRNHSPMALEALSAFALAFCLSQQWVHATQCFDQIDGRWSPYPWTLLGDPATLAPYHRALALRDGVE